MIFGAILAGGSGSRMRISQMPKQFLQLGEKPIIIHTLEKFILCDEFDILYLGTNPDWIDYMNDLIERYVFEFKERIRVVEGGKDRNSTIFNIIEAIEREFGSNEDNVIVTHDAVRPFVTTRILKDNIESVIKYDAVDTVVSATDTIVISKDGEEINQIPERKNMYQGQTPQSFNINKLKQLYADLSSVEKEMLTDACKIFTIRDKSVHLVQGEVSNFKITTVSDYKIAQAMVGGEIVD